MNLFDIGAGTAPSEPVAPTNEGPTGPDVPRSLYNKYRPSSFAEDDLVGQEHVVNTLRNAIALGRIAHAYLFCGPRGTGKTTTARLLAKAVNCLDPDPMQRPCNVCTACVAINRGATTDVIEIDAASNRGIDDIRDLRERVKYAPTQLRTVADAEQIAIDDDALAVIARHATGSLRDALGILDQVAVYCEHADSVEANVSAELVRTVLGVSRSERVETLVDALAERDAAAALRAVNAAFEAGEDIRQLGRLLVQYLRVLLLVKAGGAPDADERARQFAERFDLARLADLTRRLAEVDYRVKHATFVQLPLELALIEGCLEPEPPQTSSIAQAPSAPPPVVPAAAATPSIPPQSSLRDRVRGAPAQSATALAPAHEIREIAPPAPPAEIRQPLAASNGTANAPAVTVDGALAIEVVVDLWVKIRNDVKAVNRRVEALLQQVDPVHVNGEMVILTSPYEFHRNRLNSDEVRHVVEDVISRLVNRRVQVSCIAREEIAAMIGGSTTAATTSVAPMAPTLGATNVLANGASSPSNADASELTDDERRLQAAKNIFDAEEIGDDED